MIHFVFNQRADLNIENHRASIKKVIADLERDGLNEWIDIREETFHVLPSAFKQEGQTLTSNSKLGNVVKTAPEFIGRVQTLMKKILDPEDPSLKRKSEISDPLQWLTSSFIVFDTLRKFPDLTYYQDIHERNIDNQLREHIRNYLTETFSIEYRELLLTESLNKDEEKIEEIFAIHRNRIQKSATTKMESLFKQLKVSNGNLRKRSREFIRAQIIQMFHAALITTMAVNERARFEQIVHSGGADLKQLIEETILSGKQMSATNAKVEFENMYNKTIESITKRYNPSQRLQQAIRHIYTIYNIYENDFRFEYNNLICLESFLKGVNDTQVPIEDLKDEFIMEFTKLGSKNPSVCARTFNPGGTTVYSHEIINNLVFLNKNLLRRKFCQFLAVSSPQNTQQNKSPRSQVVAAFSGVSSKNKQNGGEERLVAPRSTDPFQVEVREAIKAESLQLSREPRHNYNEKEAYLPISTLISEVFKRVSKGMQGAENKAVRQIKAELIQRIVNSISSLIIDVKTELEPFSLELSRPLKSVLHTCTIILLTKYYYDEQMNHFRSTLDEFKDKRGALEEYYVRVVVPNSSADENFALSLVQQLKDYLLAQYTEENQTIINKIVKQYEHVNRKWIQNICDGLLLTNHDIQWNLDYIANPNKIIGKHFEDIWIGIEESVNQQLTKNKTDYIAIVENFFFCLEGKI